MVLRGCVLPRHALRVPTPWGLQRRLAQPCRRDPRPEQVPVGAGVPFHSRVSNVCRLDISHFDVRDHPCLLKAVKVFRAAEEGS